jgi:hypothetical protein
MSSPSPSSRANGGTNSISSNSSSYTLIDIEKQIIKVQKEIEGVEEQIVNTDTEIKQVKGKLEQCSEGSKQDYRDQLAASSKEKEQLRTKEEQLRDEKKVLLSQRVSTSSEGKVASISHNALGTIIYFIFAFHFVYIYIHIRCIVFNCTLSSSHIHILCFVSVVFCIFRNCITFFSGLLHCR